MGTSVCVIVVFLSLVVVSGSLSDRVSFPLTYIDAGSSLVRSVEADPSDLPQAMPMRDFVAAGRAMRVRMEKHRKVAKPLVGKFSYMGEQQGDVYLTVPVGNPPQHVSFLLDTGSEFIWCQCSPCQVCSGTKAPLFAFNKSSSFLSVPCASDLCFNSPGLDTSICRNSPTSSNPLCVFIVGYGDGSIDEGFVSVDSFHLGQHFSEKPIVFGCATVLNETVPTPSSGLMGLSAGPFSFTSQLFSSNTHIPKKFAYCLPDRFANLNARGTIEFGSYELPVSLRYTPLAPPYTPMGGKFYYVDLKGITVGGSWIKVDMKAHKVGEVVTGGTIFDSGSAITTLVKPLYDKLVKEMKRQTAHLEPFVLKASSADSKLCYKLSLNAEKLPNMPMVTLHFAGMVDLELGPESILYAAGMDDKDISICLAFNSDSEGGNLNIIGNYQQQNYWVEYNLQASSLGLAKARCAK
eukprot:c25230_g1_i1 orf=243-1631(-)